MADEYVRSYERPIYKNSNMPWLAMLIMLPLFFFFGWVTNEAFENQGNGLELVIGGAPGTEDEILSPTPDSMTEATPTITPTPIDVSPTVLPTGDVTVPLLEEESVE